MNVAMPDEKMVQEVNFASRILSIFTIVLAAGSASRFGTAKQLAKYQGRSLVQRAVHLAQQVSQCETVLVVGHDWQRVVDDCRSLAPFIVRNERFVSGMASSIACGIRAIHPVADAVLILLADQPLITADHLLTMRNAWLASPASIVASSYSETVGPPVIFPASYFESLLQLRGDHGARAVIVENKESVIRISFADAAVDVDTPGDLQKL